MALCIEGFHRSGAMSSSVTGESFKRQTRPLDQPTMKNRFMKLLCGQCISMKTDGHVKYSSLRLGGNGLSEESRVKQSFPIFWS